MLPTLIAKLMLPTLIAELKLKKESFVLDLSKNAIDTRSATELGRQTVNIKYWLHPTKRITVDLSFNPIANFEDIRVMTRYISGKAVELISLGRAKDSEDVAVPVSNAAVQKGKDTFARVKEEQLEEGGGGDPVEMREEGTLAPTTFYQKYSDLYDNRGHLSERADLLEHAP